MRYVVVYDLGIPPENFEEAIRGIDAEAEVTCVPWHVDEPKDRLAERQLNLEVNGPEAEEAAPEAYEAVADADVLITHTAPVPASLVEAGRKLRLVGCVRGGMEHVDVAACTARGIPVIHCIRNAECTSDFTVGLILAETRNIARSHRDVMAGRYRRAYVNEGYTTSMRDLCVGVVGLGHIGKLVARKLAGFGTRVIGYDPYVDAGQLADAGLDVELVGLEELFVTADVVTLHMRVTPETRNMVGADLIGRMKPTAYLVNAARAGVLDRDAFVDALRERRIGGGALDVYWEEPLAADDPLLQLDNVTLTPHIAGTVVDAIPKSPRLLAEEIRRFWETGTSEMVVNLAQLER